MSVFCRSNGQPWKEHPSPSQQQRGEIVHGIPCHHESMINTAIVQSVHRAANQNPENLQRANRKR
jgi:hypothetical protein